MTTWMWMLALVPTGWMVLFVGLVLRARVALGYWPSPYRPDPEDLEFGIHYTATLAGMPLMFAAALSSVLLAVVVCRRQHFGVRPIVPAIVAVASLAGVIALAQFDPLGLFTWLGD